MYIVCDCKNFLKFHNFFTYQLITIQLWYYFRKIVLILFFFFFSACFCSFKFTAKYLRITKACKYFCIFFNCRSRKFPYFDTSPPLHSDLAFIRAGSADDHTVNGECDGDRATRRAPFFFLDKEEERVFIGRPGRS